MFTDSKTSSAENRRHRCGSCDADLKYVMQSCMSKGVLKGKLPGVEEIRNYLLEQFQHFSIVQ